MFVPRTPTHHWMASSESPCEYLVSLNPSKRQLWQKQPSAHNLNLWMKKQYSCGLKEQCKCHIPVTKLIFWCSASPTDVQCTPFKGHSLVQTEYIIIRVPEYQSMICFGNLRGQLLNECSEHHHWRRRYRMHGIKDFGLLGSFDTTTRLIMFRLFITPLMVFRFAVAVRAIRLVPGGASAWISVILPNSVRNFSLQYNGEALYVHTSHKNLYQYYESIWICVITYSHKNSITGTTN